MSKLIISAWLTFVVCTPMASALADVPASIFWYQEKETGTPAGNMRYLVVDKFLRIDEGDINDDFILFDAEKNTIYSVNQADQSVLVISNHAWQMPEFEFDHQVDDRLMQDAPKIAGKSVKRYLVSGDDKVCTDVQYVPGLYSKQMDMLRHYQQVLSGQQVRTLANTPEELHSPCFLADQVYNDGAYYARGLPIQIWHSRGYGRILIDFKDEPVNQQLFVIPEGFRQYNPYIK